ncbi:MAG: type II toxin-antitoxin system RelE/ParE family toxin [Patescibacteria group bacterium]
MIKSFKDKETNRIFSGEISRKLPFDIQRTAKRKLLMINAIDNIFDLSIPPSNHLEKLKGDRWDQYSIRINQQWRICFHWQNKDAYNVEITDYH